MTNTNSPAAQPQGVELSQCRFCNGNQSYFAERDVGWLEDRETDRRIVVVCSGCGAQGPAFGFMGFNNQITAAQYWNDTRADLPRATADDMRAMLKPDVWHCQKCSTLLTFQGDTYSCEGCELMWPAHNIVLFAYADLTEESFLAAPRATGETTVEAALVELRKMFPLPHDLIIALSDYGGVVSAEIYMDARLIAKGKTLVEAMAQVRAAAQTEAGRGDR